MFNNFSSENEIMPKNMVERDRPQTTILRRMRTACLITKVTDTHIEYITFIAFPLQQSLRERASIYVTRKLLVLFWHSSLQDKFGRKTCTSVRLAWKSYVCVTAYETIPLVRRDFRLQGPGVRNTERRLPLFEEWSGRPPPHPHPPTSTGVEHHKWLKVQERRNACY